MADMNTTFKLELGFSSMNPQGILRLLHNVQCLYYQYLNHTCPNLLYFMMSLNDPCPKQLAHN